MNDYRRSMDEYVGTAPRTSIDVDELVGRGRRAQRGRRLAAATGGLALSAAAALAAVNVLPAPDPGPGQGLPVAAASARPSEVTAQRLLTVLKAALVREAPGVTGLATLHRQMYACLPGSGAPPDARLVPYDAATFDTACPAGSLFHAERERQFDWIGVLTVRATTVEVRFHVGRADGAAEGGGAPASPGFRQQSNVSGDQLSTGPNGERIRVNEVLVQVIKRDGTGFLAVNPEKRALPLTELWTAIGLDPALRL